MVGRLTSFLLFALIIANAHGSEFEQSDGLGKLRTRLQRLVPISTPCCSFEQGTRMPRFIPTDPNLVHHIAQLGKAQARMLKLVPIESNQAPHAVDLGKALGRMLRLVPTSLN
ncbi:hypothetical protein WN943_015640 [Citrus x changshan-huyou]